MNTIKAKAIAVGVISIMLAWLNTDPLLDYTIVERVESSIYGAWDTIGTTNAYEFMDYDIQTERRYFYRVYWCNDNSWSPVFADSCSDESNLASGMFIDWSQDAAIAERRTFYTPDSTHFLVVDIHPAGEHWVCTWDFGTLEETVRCECDLDENDDGVIGISDVVYFATKYWEGLYDEDDLTALIAIYGKQSKFYYVRSQ